MSPVEAAASSSKKIKLFLSHASEDKDDFVRPLFEALETAGFDPWFDEKSLVLGDSLLQKIGAGLRDSDYGIVVLSPAFFRKDWPANELNGLFSLETRERKVILPIWKDVSQAEVKAYSPILADRLGVATSMGVAEVVRQIKIAVGTSEATKKAQTPMPGAARFQAMAQNVSASKKVKKLSESQEGAERALAGAEEIINRAREVVLSVDAEHPVFGLNVREGSGTHDLLLSSKLWVTLRAHYIRRFRDTLTGSFFHFQIYFHKGYRFDEDHPRNVTRKGFFRPQFDPALNLIWEPYGDDDGDGQVIFVSPKQSMYASHEVADLLLGELADELSKRFVADP